METNNVTVRMKQKTLSCNRVFVSPHPARALKEKIHLMVALPKLSNQDRELHKEEVLSAHAHIESRSLLVAAMSRNCHLKW